MTTINEMSREKFLELMEERERILREELLGDEMRVRGKGYKKMAKVIVQVSKRPDWQTTGPEWRVVFTYPGRSHQGGQVARFARLDVNTFNGWRTVWDDGVDDISQWDQPKLKLPKCPRWRSGTLG